VALPRDASPRLGEGNLPTLLQICQTLDDCAQKLPFFLVFPVIAKELEHGDWCTPMRQQHGGAGIHHPRDNAVRISL
jgi:hypothetical protein